MNDLKIDISVILRKCHNIPVRYVNASFGDFPSMRVEVLPDKGFLLCGNSGIGKTHFLCALARHLYQDGKKFMFINLPDALITLRREMIESSDDLFSTMRNVPYLLLDDLGAEKLSEYAYTAMYSILNHRFNEMLHTSITTNVDFNQWDERLSHRITALTKVVKLRR